MRRILFNAASTALAAAIAVTLTGPAAAASGAAAGPSGSPAPVITDGAADPADPAGAVTGRGGWEPWPSPVFDLPAGSRCDFPVHMEAVVDEVQRRVLEFAPDGTTVRRAAFRGALVLRLTNTTTGASYDADAGGRSVVDYRPDTSQTWHARGPILLGVGTGAGNLPRDLYTVDGVYTIDISATGYRTLTFEHGSAEPLCAKIA
ncbi:hypothetical protein ACFVVA_01940 [Kitasatospora sp. NPDC058048]|uniref:hypothetical protein n=1 Tax=Kitasatospora sp. NPDC058048 TaxID=3346313 RepID=UPI0036DF2806